MATEEEVDLTFQQKTKLFFSLYWKTFVLILTPLLLIPLLLTEYTKQHRCGFIILMMVTFWVTEAMPMYVTAFIPIALFPVLGILDTNSTCRLYFQDTVIFFFGGIILALAVEFSRLHKRVALKAVTNIGCKIIQLHIGIVVVSALLSMWLSSVATTTMMCPIIRALLEELEREGLIYLYEDKSTGETIKPLKGERTIYDPDMMKTTKIATGFYCGIAFSSSIGGTGSLLGAENNLVLKGMMESLFPGAPGIRFDNYLYYNVPIMFILLVGLELWLLIVYFGLFRKDSEDAKISHLTREGEAIAHAVLLEKAADLGPITAHELTVGAIFVTAIFLFLTMNPGVFPGWAVLFPDEHITGPTPLIGVIYLIFALPASYTCFKFCQTNRRIDLPEKRPMRAMTWSYLYANGNWGLLFLLGGGFALAEGGRVSGLTKDFAEYLSHLEGNSPFMLLVTVVLIVACVTEITANVPTASIFIPIVANVAVSLKINPLYVVLPTNIACGMTFLLAAATPSNMFIGSFAGVSVMDLAIAGSGPKIISYFIIILVCPYWGRVVFSDLNEYPDWADFIHKNESSLENVMN